MRYRNDPYETTARFNSTCKKCGQPIRKDDRIAYWPATKTALCWKCGEADLHTCQAACAAEDMGL